MQKSYCLAVLVLTAFLLPGLAPAQEAPGEPPARKSSPEALAILAEAIATQGPEEYAKEGAIRDLTVKIQAEVWDHSRQPAEKTALDVNRYLTMEPERFRSDWKTTAGTDVYGYDGVRYWFAEYGTGGGLVDLEHNPRWLLGDKYREDRSRIQDEIAETHYLLRFFFLANLRGPQVVFTMADDDGTDGLGDSVHRLRRDNLDPESTEPPLTLAIDRKTLALVRAKALATDQGRKSLIFSFRYDEAVQPRVKGVLFPFRIETREQPFGAEKSRLANRATVRPNGIAFNTGLDPELFKMPK